MIQEILKNLPQIQCEECGYKGCRPYAEAIMEGEDIDLCAPGGQVVLDRLRDLVKREGDSNKADSRYIPPKQALINQDICIGCTKCIAPCPTNAIVGNKKTNHFVLGSDCTGCGLCLPYCPVDCIDLVDDSLSLEGKLSLSEDFLSLYQKKNDAFSERTLEKKTASELQKELAGLFGGEDESS